jgi:hypothetical protein
VNRDFLIPTRKIEKFPTKYVQCRLSCVFVVLLDSHKLNIMFVETLTYLESNLAFVIFRIAVVVFFLFIKLPFEGGDILFSVVMYNCLMLILIG